MATDRPVFSRVWRNPDPRFDRWWEDAAAKLDRLTNEHARAFMVNVFADRDFVAPGLSEESIGAIYQWAGKHHLIGWSQDGVLAVLTERVG